MKRKKQNKQANKKKYADADGLGIPVEKIYVDKNAISVDKVSTCSYRRGKYCLIRDDDCIPYSIKCKKNRKVYKNDTFSTVQQKNDSLKNSRYIGSYKETQSTIERYGQNKDITVADTGKEVVLYVFKGFLNLKKEYTIDYYVYVSDIKTSRHFRLLVAYNSKTKKYYISDTQIKRMHKQGVFPNAIFYACNDGSIPLVGVEFHEFSKLAIYGYSAGKNGLSVNDRHRIINYVLDKKIMRKYEIIEHLQGLIHLREQRDDKDFSVAIRNWKDDIEYVNNYKIGDL